MVRISMAEALHTASLRLNQSWEEFQTNFMKQKCEQQKMEGTIEAVMEK